MQFGRMLRALLWERDIAPSEFAREVGVSASYLSRIVLHARTNPSSAVFTRIIFGFASFGPAKALSPAEILDLLAARHADESYGK